MAAHLLTRTGAATGSANQLAAASGTDGRASAGPVALTAAIEGKQARLLAIPARNGGRPVIALAGTSTGIAQTAKSRVRTPTLTAAPLAAAAAGLAAWLLTGTALHPVERIRRQLTEITEHHAANI